MTGRRARTGTLAALAAIGLVVVAATLPLDVVARRLLGPEGAITAADARGTPWRGTLRGVRLQGSPMGDVDVRLRVLPLLLGRAVVQLRGPALDARLLRGARVGLADATGTIDLPAPPSLTGARVTVALADAGLAFADDRCIDASGTVTATLLLPDPALPPLRLAGPVSCIAGHGRVALAGASGEVGAVFDVAADGAWRLQATAPAPAPGLRIALQLAGFEDGDGVLQRTWRGRLDGAPAPATAGP